MGNLACESAFSYERSGSIDDKQVFVAVPPPGQITPPYPPPPLSAGQGPDQAGVPSPIDSDGPIRQGPRPESGQPRPTAPALVTLPDTPDSAPVIESPPHPPPPLLTDGGRRTRARPPQPARPAPTCPPLPGPRRLIRVEWTSLDCDWARAHQACWPRTCFGPCLRGAECRECAGAITGLCSDALRIGCGIPARTRTGGLCAGAAVRAGMPAVTVPSRTRLAVPLFPFKIMAVTAQIRSSRDVCASESTRNRKSPETVEDLDSGRAARTQCRAWPDVSPRRRRLGCEPCGPIMPPFRRAGRTRRRGQCSRCLDPLAGPAPPPQAGSPK